MSGHDDEQRFGLTTTSRGPAVVVGVSGELDLHSAPRLMDVVDEAMRDQRTDLVVIDLSAVDFLGSSGLGVLANLATRATVPTSHRQDGTAPPAALRVVAPPDHRPVTRPWAAMSLQQILPLYPTVDDAVEGGLEP
ncbi:STAS domain-containing protein [Pseudonocardia humida]|uniref:Anti-sigma factor antagonist n=1 Tax=Pseudonocardia humida TaxID=2800819 RepID=A0ABT0ZYQ9_9PSEU|nr:STAS domain-containing protein [Pseudonocardia humida]MCO1655784.1 STAS domain-containing protein [Pseudonocardia humida]